MYVWNVWNLCGIGCGVWVKRESCMCGIYSLYIENIFSIYREYIPHIHYISVCAGYVRDSVCVEYILYIYIYIYMEYSL